jgi:flagellar hook assembly protein FlgD
MVKSPQVEGGESLNLKFKEFHHQCNREWEGVDEKKQNVNDGKKEEKRNDNKKVQAARRLENVESSDSLLENHFLPQM